MQCPRCKKQDVPKIYTTDVGEQKCCTYCAPQNSTENGVPIPWTSSEDAKATWAQDDATRGTIPDGPPSLQLLQLKPKKKPRR